MRIWLDDKRPTRAGFDVHVKTAMEAIRVIYKNRLIIKEIAFDQHLGEASEVGDGYAVATFVERLAFRKMIKRIKWGVHSDNGPGRLKIIWAMESAERFWSEDSD